MTASVLSQLLDGWTEPELVFSAVAAGRPRAVWLDSGPAAVSGTSAIATSSTLVTSSVSTGTVTVDGVDRPGSIFDFLRDQVQVPVPGSNGAAAGFRLGWVGWLGYGLRADSLGIPVVNADSRPDAALLYVDRAVVFDHAARTVELIALGSEWTQELSSWRDETRAAIESAVPVVAGRPPSAARAVWRDSDEDYLGMIAECQAAIGEGEAYQLCLTSEAVVDIRPDPVATYLALRSASPSHHGSLLLVDGTAVLGASPERFLSVSPEGEIESKPIKGTRPRSPDPVEDARLAAELLASEKERAENLMIVDLMRNDIAQVSELGSVAVPSLLAVESYAQVHQLVSTVRGRLADGLTAVDAVVACFPAGSMTGTPKRRAVQLLDRLEHRARGIYSGAIGYFGLDGRVDLAMVIRSIVIDATGSTVGAGGGITALSVPAEELAEVRLKAAVLLSVLGAVDFR